MLHTTNVQTAQRIKCHHLCLHNGGMQCVCFFSGVVTVELTDCENAKSRKNHANPGP